MTDNSRADPAADAHIHPRICPYCEQNCATEVTVDPLARKVVTVRGDKADPLSKGYICPKAYAIKDLHDDPEKLRGPVIRRGDRFEEVSWDEALDFTAERLGAIVREHGGPAIASYFGTALTHNPGLTLYSPLLLTTLGTNQVYSASSVDSHAHFMASVAMFGSAPSLPIPDIDNCDYFVIIGANPLQSNGSFMTAPGVPRRLRAIRARGGRVVVIDPRRTETADVADWHLSIAPGADAALLLAMIGILFDEDRVTLGALADHAKNVEALRDIARRISPAQASAASGIAVEDIYRLTRELAAAPRACVYGRVGSSMQQFGSITCWLINALNALTGNLDSEGGAMFPQGVFEAIAFADRWRDGVLPYGRWHSRVRGLPELAGQLPCAALREEIATPGEDRVRALITLCGNPVLSLPNGGGALSEAIDSLEFIVSFDIFINETSRRADVILPSPDSLCASKFMVIYPFFTVRDYIRWNAPAFDLPEGAMHDDAIICEIVARMKGISAAEADETALRMLYDQLREQGNPVMNGLDFETVLARLDETGGQDRMFEMLIRSGPYGDHFGERPDGLTMAALRAAPHGIDFGPMRPRVEQIVHFPDGRIDFAPEAIVRDMPRFEQWLATAGTGDRGDGLELIGRRQMRSFNTWMHNLPSLAKGPNLCRLRIHPDDARARGIADGQMVRIRSAVGEIEIAAEISDEVRAGVVSLPHGFGHDDEKVPGQERAKARAGASYNLLADDTRIDEPSCNVNLNQIPVTVVPVSQPAMAASAAQP